MIGTTADYVDWIRNARPGQAVFVTSPEERRKATQPAPPKEEEILCDLKDTGKVLEALRVHLRENHLTPAGVACFDCESMSLAAAAAGHFNLDYPSMESIRACRDKSLSKILWRENGVDCPAFSSVSTLQELKSFFMRQKGPVVLKPMTGSGSELVYRCDTLAACGAAYGIVVAELEKRKENRLYSGAVGPKPLLAEALVTGREYSCDFIWTGKEIEMIRVAEKVKPGDAPFGTIGGYVLPACLPGDVARKLLVETLPKASRALGLTRCICMADFILSDNRVFMIEMSPRPGGDCLPFMLRYALGVDMPALAVDFAAGRPVAIPGPRQEGAFMGVRIHAQKEGVLRHVKMEEDKESFKILETHFIRNPGHDIHMPPTDYDSWFLGHVIVKLGEGEIPQQEYRRICSRLDIEIEDRNKGSEYDGRATFGSAA